MADQNKKPDPGAATLFRQLIEEAVPSDGMPGMSEDVVQEIASMLILIKRVIGDQASSELKQKLDTFENRVMELRRAGKPLRDDPLVAETYEYLAANKEFQNFQALLADPIESGEAERGEAIRRIVEGQKLLK